MAVEVTDWGVLVSEPARHPVGRQSGSNPSISIPVVELSAKQGSGNYRIEVADNPTLRASRDYFRIAG